MMRRPPRSTLFPYPPLSRSHVGPQPSLGAEGDRRVGRGAVVGVPPMETPIEPARDGAAFDASRRRDRKSTRLNSSHANISYAVFCLKKKKKIKADGSFIEYY